MRTSRNAMIQEAVRRMEALGYYKGCIDAFEKDGTVFVSEPPMYARILPDERLAAEIKRIEKEYDCLVYAVIHSYADFGELYNLLIVEDYPEEWEYFVGYEFYEGFDFPCASVFSYVINRDNPMFSEFGHVLTVATKNRGLVRVA